MKNKSKKKGLSDALYAKKAQGVVKKVNPFELHQSIDKFEIINRRKRHSLGAPTRSRQIAFDRRKETLGKEFEIKHKSNSFKDTRKSGFRVKESIYNLNDTEVLTHRGQTLSEIQRFDDFAHEEDEEMSDEELKLDSKFTEAAHFGNFVGDQSEKDRKAVIDELIAESKKRKQERARETEEIINMTDKLDSEWRELLPVIKTLKQSEKDKEMHQPDEYDKLVKEMIFSPRAEPAEKLKTEEEIARLEKEKLSKLERERLARMRDDEDEGEKKIKHKSADDLDDGYFMQETQEDEEKTLAYDIDPEGAESSKDNDEDEIADDEEEQQEINEVEESADEEESEADSMEDLKEDESSEEEEVNDEKVDDEEESESEDEDDESSSSTKEESSKKQKSEILPSCSKVDENAEILKNIPYTIQMPSSYENLEKLIGKHPTAVQITIIDRIIKTNHPKLLHANKSKMLKLFAYLLQFLNDKFTNIDSKSLNRNFKLLQSLSPYLYDLIHMNPADASNCYMEVMKEKYEDFKKNPKNLPQLDTLIFFELLGKLFPTSDFRHSVVTPVNIFVHHIFSQAKVKTKSEIARGLFLATIVLDYQKLSKKFLPSVLNFLMGVSYLGSGREVTQNIKPIPPFKRTEPILLITEEFEDDFDVSSKLTGDDLLEDELDDDFRARALNVNCQLIRDFMKLYEDHVGVIYLIDFQLMHLKSLVKQKNLPSNLKVLIKSIIKDFNEMKSNKKFVYPQPDKKPTPILRLLEPLFETVLSDRRSMYAEARGGKIEEKKLQHMVKREFKAAKRELRRDNEFISKIRFKRSQEQDRERQAKVKRIFNDASIQQSEYKKMSNKKKNSKF